MKNSKLNVNRFIAISKRKRELKQRRVLVAKLFVGVLIISTISISNIAKLHANGNTLTVNAEENTKSNTVVKEEPKRDFVIPKQEDIAPKKEAVAPAKTEEPQIYISNIPMSKEHQEYLYKLCVERGLDFKKMLAVIKHESVFDQSLISETNDYGYCQVNKVNHAELAEELHTANRPLDPYINLNWGTYMMSNIYRYWESKGYTGSELDKMVWSEYNKGRAGVIKTGLARNYVSKVEIAYGEIVAVSK